MYSAHESPETDLVCPPIHLNPSTARATLQLVEDTTPASALFYPHIPSLLHILLLILEFLCFVALLSNRLQPPRWIHGTVGQIWVRWGRLDAIINY